MALHMYEKSPICRVAANPRCMPIMTMQAASRSGPTRNGIQISTGTRNSTWRVVRVMSSSHAAGSSRIRTASGSAM